MVAMLQFPWVFPRVSCLESAKAVQCSRPKPKIGAESQQIPRYSPVCPRGQPPGMAADKCIIGYIQVVPQSRSGEKRICNGARTSAPAVPQSRSGKKGNIKGSRTK